MGGRGKLTKRGGAKMRKMGGKINSGDCETLDQPRFWGKVLKVAKFLGNFSHDFFMGICDS